MFRRGSQNVEPRRAGSELGRKFWNRQKCTNISRHPANTLPTLSLFIGTQMHPIFFAQASQVTLLDRILDPPILIFLIPIVAIVSGCVISVTKTIVRHRERLVMIENGFDPDGNANVAQRTC